MSGRNIILDDRHYKAASDKARELGTTPEQFICSLIDAATMSFDEILAPVRQAFAAEAVTEQDLNDAVAEARRELSRRPLGCRSRSGRSCSCLAHNSR